MRSDFAQVTRDLRVAGLLSLPARFQTMTNGNTYVHNAIAAVTTSRNLLRDVAAEVGVTTLIDYDGHADDGEVTYIASALALTAVWYCSSLASWTRKPGWSSLRAELIRLHTNSLRPRLEHVQLLTTNGLGHHRVSVEGGCSWDALLEDRWLPTNTRTIPRCAPPHYASGLSKCLSSESAAWERDYECKAAGDSSPLGGSGIPDKPLADILVTSAQAVVAEAHVTLPYRRWQRCERCHFFSSNRTRRNGGCNRMSCMEECAACLEMCHDCADYDLEDLASLDSSLRLGIGGLQQHQPLFDDNKSFADDSNAINNGDVGAADTTGIANHGFYGKQSLPLPLGRGATHRRGHIRLTKRLLQPGTYSQQAVNPPWWNWVTLLLEKGRVAAHFDQLESRDALLALHGKCRSKERLGIRWVHLLDSFMHIVVTTKRRASLDRLNRVVNKRAIRELTTLSATAIGFTRSRVNPGAVTFVRPRHKLLLDHGNRRQRVVGRRTLGHLVNITITETTLEQYLVPLEHSYYWAWLTYGIVHDNRETLEAQTCV